MSTPQHLSKTIILNDNTGGAGGTLQVTLGGYKGQPQCQVGVANKKDDVSERHRLDKGREEEGCHKEENRYSHTRHFPKTVTKKPENHYSHTGHFQNSNAIKKPENHYSQTRHFPKSSTTKKPENQYSTTRHFPKSNATKKPDSDVNDHVYHALDMSGEKSDAHKDPQVGKNVYHILEEEAGDNSHIQEKENEYSALQGPGDDDDTCKNGQEGKHEYHVLEGPGDNSDTNADIQEGEHKYHVLEGLRDYSDTNMDIQEGEHEYHVLEGMTPELEGEEGDEQG